MPKGNTAASTDDYHTDKNLASFFRLPKSSGFKRPVRLNSEAAIEEIQHSLFHETDIPCPIRIPFMGPGGRAAQLEALGLSAARKLSTSAVDISSTNKLSSGHRGDVVRHKHICIK